MDPESKRLIEETLRLAEENNKMLRKVRNVQKWDAFWRSLKIIFIVAVALGALYFLEPYINKVVDLYNSISGAAGKVNDATGSFQDLLKNF
jgi:hypothetical protein